MGREATCDCTFDGTTAKVKALLETNEIILRGPIRLTAPLKALKSIRVESETLCFSLDKHPIQLHLGAKAAESWAKKLKTPPPTLADKLGITGKTIRTIGPIDDKALLSALSAAAMVRAKDPDIVLVLHRHTRIPCHYASSRKATTSPLNPHLARLPQGPRPRHQRKTDSLHPPRSRLHGHQSSLSL